MNSLKRCEWYLLLSWFFETRPAENHQHLCSIFDVCSLLACVCYMRFLELITRSAYAVCLLPLFIFKFYYRKFFVIFHVRLYYFDSLKCKIYLFVLTNVCTLILSFCHTLIHLSFIKSSVFYFYFKQKILTWIWSLNSVQACYHCIIQFKHDKQVRI